jgi:hypothetical protein
MVLNDQFHAPAALLPENETLVLLNSRLGGCRVDLDALGRDKAHALAENRTTVSQLLALKHRTDYASPSMRNKLVRIGVYDIVATALTGRKYRQQV